MQKKVSDKTQSRRKTLIKIGAIASSPVWSKPLVQQVILPVHASTTDGTTTLPPDGTTTTPPGGTTTTPPGGTTTLPPGVTTTTLPPISGQGEVFICAANGRNCVSQGTIGCGGNLNIGTLQPNNAVRVIIAGFPPNETVSVSAPGNENCINCSGNTATTDGSGNLNLLFSTGAGGVQHTVTITLRGCSFQISWVA